MEYLLHIEHRDGQVRHVPFRDVADMRRCAIDIRDREIQNGAVALLVDGDIHFKRPCRLLSLHMGYAGPLFQGRRLEMI